VTGRVVVVGGGIAGATAALRLAGRGHDVVLTERSDRLGGLVVSFEVGGTPLECFYHHVFPHEHHIVGLVDELGLGAKLDWRPSTVGVLTGGRLWPFTSPVDLLRFGPLAPLDRVRAGVGALRLARVGDWEQLDSVPAVEWLAGLTGGRAAEVIWEPLLRAKFGPASGEVPAAWVWGRFQQRAGGRRRGGERLGYLRGGFRQLFDALHRRLIDAGVDVRTSTPVDRILTEGPRVHGVEAGGSTLPSSAVVYAGALPGLPRLLSAQLVDERWGAIGGLGVLCVVLEMTQPVSDIYWTNVCDSALPFGGVIEHTNFVPPADYGGRHVLYVSRYFTTDEQIARADPDEEAARWVDALDDRFPGFDKRNVLAVHAFRTPYAAPLVTVGHLTRIPPLRSHVDGLYVCTTAQIYPQDRGMSEGVRTGGEAADAVHTDQAVVPTGGMNTGGGQDWRCPVCGGVEWRTLYPLPATGSESGVDPESFRPSADRFGQAVGEVVRCAVCGHGSLLVAPAADAVARAYADAADPVSVREEAGQVQTAQRALEEVERFVTPGLVCDIGCWTGSLLVAARERGWRTVGVEPSSWASQRARDRGLDVRTGDLDAHGLEPATCTLVVLADVLEHLSDPGHALGVAHDLLEPGGVLHITVPNAGSPPARVLGRRWWSVLPMHVQYFTKSSLLRLLSASGFAAQETHSHAKAFSARYYAERLGGYSAGLERAAVKTLERLGYADKLVAPDLHDRLAVIAVRT